MFFICHFLVLIIIKMLCLFNLDCRCFYEVILIIIIFHFKIIIVLYYLKIIYGLMSYSNFQSYQDLNQIYLIFVKNLMINGLRINLLFSFFMGIQIFEFWLTILLVWVSIIFKIYKFFILEEFIVNDLAFKEKNFEFYFI